MPDRAGHTTQVSPPTPSLRSRQAADSYCGSRLCNGGGEACFAAAIVPGA